MEAWAPRFLGIMRIVVGLLFLQHGLAKLFGWPHVAMFDNLHAFQLVWFAGIIEFVGGILLTIGLWTRCAAFVMSGEMAVAYFMSHALRGFFPIINNGEGAILYCFIFFYYFLAGSGRYSIDNARA
ncbi:MAG: DoxX family protein [Alphaproteobacteria bacterium]|nr:DoxX family protein [Alphaproteobacteria bacterium]